MSTVNVNTIKPITDDVHLNLQAGGSTRMLLTSAGSLSGGATGSIHAPGMVLQVVHAIDSTKLRTAATTYTATGLSGTITPSSTSSKILIHMNAYISTDNATPGNGSTVKLKLKRGTTDLTEPTVMYNLDQSQSGGNARQSVTVSHIFLDEPASTDSLIYNYDMKADSGANYTAWLHDTWGGTPDQSTLPPMSATIVLQEIAG